jgi:hypothetical protein
MDVNFNLYAASFGLALCTSLSAYADNTVRTGSQGNQSFNSIENARALFFEMMNVIRGEVLLVTSELDDVEQRLINVLREVNNQQPVIYTTETVYVQSESWSGGGDDGGSGGGGSCG